MRLLCIHFLLILLHSTGVKSQELCGESDVSGAVGGAVTLRVTSTGTRTITWTFGEKSDNIALTRAGGELEIQDPRYDGRLRSSSDGSLTITDLQHGDQGTYRAAILTQRCYYQLSVFSNLTAEDLTITSNVTNNETCEVLLTCSVNSTKRRNVTITWRSLERGETSLTSSMTVPPNTINFTYICTAKNPVSEVSKSVIPREQCEKGDPPGGRHMERIYISFVAVVIVILIIIVVCLIQQQRSRRKDRAHVEKSNCAERRDAERAPVLDDTEQTKKKINQKKNGEQEPSTSGVISVYDQVHPVPNAESEKSKGKQPTPSKEKGTVGKNKDPQGRDGRKPAPPAPNGKASDPPLESCYAQVYLPQDQNNQKASPEGANGNVTKPPEEAFYEEVPHCEGGAKQDPSKAAVESLYSQVTFAKATEPANNSVHYSVRS